METYTVRQSTTFDFQTILNLLLKEGLLQKQNDPEIITEQFYGHEFVVKTETIKELKPVKLTPDQKKLLSEMSLKDFGLTSRQQKILEDIHSLHDSLEGILHLDYTDLVHIRGIGPSSIRKILDGFDRIGIPLERIR